MVGRKKERSEQEEMDEEGEERSRGKKQSSHFRLQFRFLRSSTSKHKPCHDSEHILETVEEVALLIKKLAINSSHGPCLQRSIILNKLQELHKHSEVEPGSSETLIAPFSYESGELEGFMMDPIWDMLNFFPNVHGTHLT